MLSKHPSPAPNTVHRRGARLRAVGAAVLCLLAGGAAARELPREPATRDPVAKARWLVELGDAHLENGAVAKACKAYDDATEVLPTWWIARLGAVRCGRLVGRPVEELAAHLEAAEQAYPTGPLIHLQRGILSEDQGDLAGARAAYDMALDLAPQLREARRRLAAVAMASGDWGTARAELERLVEGPAADPLARVQLARAYEQLGLPTEAAAQLEHVVRAAPFRRGAQVRLMRLYERIGDARAAARVRQELDGTLGAADRSTP